MSSPFWSYPGVWQGRLAPTQSTYYAYDSGELYYYSEWWVDDWYYYYEGEEGAGLGHVFCLGSDQLEPPRYRLEVGDAVSVEQSFYIQEEEKLLRFGWRMRMPSAMPQRKVIVDSGPVEFKSGSLLSSGDGLKGVIVESPDAQMDSSDDEQLFTISGSGDEDNNGTFRVSAIPLNIAGVSGGDIAVLENSGLAPRSDPSVTIVREGLQWVARAYVNVGGGFEERVKLIEEPGHVAYRNELALHLSKFTGDITVKFEMKLELVPAP
jgi:hypothetical protein